MLIDTHAHLDFPQFDKDRDKVIQQAKKAKVEKIINVGSLLEGTKKSVKLAQKYPEIYAAVGIHPHDVEDIKILRYEDIKSELKRLVQKPKVVAIGECGLDFHPVDQGKILKEVTERVKEKQKEVFKIQLELAQELKLPVIIHCRDAHKEILNLLVSYTSISNRPKGVLHCFSGDQKFLNKILEMGFYIGFCGNLTFKNAKSLQETALIAPLEKILLETDCPFLSPEPLRGLRNEPGNVKLIAEFLASLRNINFEKICQVTSQNAKNLFKIR